jgi:hypothetical protein
MKKLPLLIIAGIIAAFAVSCSIETPGISSEADAIKASNIINQAITAASQVLSATKAIGGTRAEALEFRYDYPAGGYALLSDAAVGDFAGSNYAGDVVPNEEAVMFKIEFFGVKVSYERHAYTLDGSYNYYISTAATGTGYTSLVVMYGNVSIDGPDLSDTCSSDVKMTMSMEMDETTLTITATILGTVNGITVNDTQTHTQTAQIPDPY